MTKPKSGGLARLPKEQKSHFLIGPVSSWFMPNTTDLWTQTKRFQEISMIDNEDGGDEIDCYRTSSEDSHRLSYFVYGSIGCFCYGEIHHRPQATIAGENRNQNKTQIISSNNQLSAIVNTLVDVKDDNSRVACVRFLKDAPFPIVLVLTESGSILIHDCFLKQNLVHYKKNEVLTKFVGLSSNDEAPGEHCTKRTKFNVTQQINSCSWPRADTILLGVSLLREKNCLLLSLKLSDIFSSGNRSDQKNKDEFVLEPHKIDLELQQYASPICLVESAMLDEKVCVAAVGMDDGLITVVVMDLDTNKKLRTIKLARHNDQICSISLSLTNKNKFPLGLLASVARDGLVLIWDIENEFYFADYLAIQGVDRGSGSKINWFSLRFIDACGIKHTYLAVSNVESGITVLEVPEKARSKVRLKCSGESKSRRPNMAEQTLKHNALIFTIEYDPFSETMITSSLDGNHILWSLQRSTATDNSSQVAPISFKPQFLNPAMLNNARTHMLRHNPIKEDLMCLALGKGGIKFYNITKNLPDSRFDMTASCALISRKVAKASVSPTSVAWHPNHEYRLAIGTIEGKLYRADITPRKAALIEAESNGGSINDSKETNSLLNDALGVDYQPMVREEASISSKNNVQRSRTDGIYSLCWGPNPASPQDITKHAIYAVASISHKLSIYYANNSDKLTNYLDEFKDKSLPEAIDQASEVTWKSSMDLMALGTTDGRIIIATYLDESHQERSNNRLFKVLTIIKGPLGDSFVQCLVWHPTTDNDDPNYYKIVASSNDSPAFVFNLKETILVADVKDRLRIEQSNGSDTTGAETATNMLSAYVNKLDAHQKAITDIGWNPHERNQLATCSFDRTCFVWSINSCLMDAHIIARFSARDRLFTLEWSLVDSNLIYTSGNDSIIWAWRPTENRVRHHEVSST